MESPHLQEFSASTDDIVEEWELSQVEKVEGAWPAAAPRKRHGRIPVEIKFYAHASFRLEADGLSVVTDPYTPGPDGSNFEPIDEPADLVIMSSATDAFHSDPSHVSGDPVVVNALELPQEGREVLGLHIRPFPAMESMIFDFGRERPVPVRAGRPSRAPHGRHRQPGSRGTPREAARQRGRALRARRCPRTIGLEDLDAAIEAIGPRVVIPMHYHHPRGVLDIEPVDTFPDRFPGRAVTRIGGPELGLTPDSLPPDAPHAYVLEPSR